MIERTLYHIAFSKEWGRQMRFITGPRQSGKTTLAKHKLKNEKIMAGIDLQKFDYELKNSILIAVTEKRSQEEMDRYLQAVNRMF